MGSMMKSVESDTVLSKLGDVRQATISLSLFLHPLNGDSNANPRVVGLNVINVTKCRAVPGVD